MLSLQERRRLFSGFLLLQIVCTCFVTINGDNEQEKKLYIVYMGDSPKPVFMSSLIQNSAADEHVSMLKNVVGSPVAAKESITRSYVNHFNAFAAKLSPEEAKQLQNKKNVISVFPNGYKTLHTTKSWDFLGFPETVKRDQKLESNLVVGVLDSGITPDSESFNDKGFGPPPAKWKGTCGPFVNFTGCNNKIVGARYFKLDGTVDPADVLSPIDLKGHGTHTASTIVGNAVHDASLFGVGKGTARGAVPSARVAMYKVCWVTDTCSDIDILAAFEAAIEDGVDIISISLGSNTTLRDTPHNYFQDVIAIGSFHAMKKGILTVASAGNNGPSLDTVDNHAPWVLTVGATGTNRQYRSKIKLGNGQILSGIGMNTFDLEEKLYPLITGEAGSVKLNPSAYDPYMDAGLCKGNVLDTMKVKGKLVVSGFDEMADQQHPADFVVSKSGGIGTIVIDNYGIRTNDTAGHYQCPATMVNTSTGGIIASYIKSTSSPTAVIYKTEEVNVSAPFVPQFSGRGPNKGSRRLLK
ncbi:hypothetical protein MKW94_026101, partial [Papaver nudicaule]|nr:hypothetical protein [Papaver nudicaule]